MAEPLVSLSKVSKSFGDTRALRDISAEIRGGVITGLVGPDGAGKTTLIRLMTGLLAPEDGRIRVLGADTLEQAQTVQSHIGYMPQRFGLYEDLSVIENLNLYADLRGLPEAERADRFAELLRFTGLSPFTTRHAGKLSGGMKQKLGLACALIRTPRVLLLDEPSVGVDPISRRELWRMVQDLKDEGIAIVWSTSYLDEAERCDDVLLLNRGELLFAGPPADLTQRVEGRTFLATEIEGVRRAALAEALDTEGIIDGVVQGSALRLVTAEKPEDGTAGLSRMLGDCFHGADLQPVAPRFEDAFINVLGGVAGGTSRLAQRIDSKPDGRAIIEAQALTKKFGDFTAARDITFSIPPGEIFGLLGPNGAGKSTTFKMLCGLLKPTEGIGRVAEYDLRKAGATARGRLGYMAQTFSLYGDLSVLQNLRFFASVYGLPRGRRREKIESMIETFDLPGYLDMNARDLPLGIKQRLALACAVMHEPDALFLDEPTSGVDPITRREFWTHINGLVAKGVAILVTTHFMDEAEYCDRIALMYRGETIALDSPDALKAQARTDECPDPSLEDAFIHLVQTSESDRKEAA
ncbi:ATP-binding cassette domain-containing protein [Dichotomicrobium thermohalophilum]|uniref:ABC-2 type transport system ATP-binding protein n=1 Tax=Dichotomicrobium thermohalophilum TaxID=933063 RepID=A0A397QCK9_9HYPH|nr:ATP-binding cassette domain-containing protein [Dichotomicrobium thermohalophilum]RIA55991.1 ABC-2 type transport system ATP-binding protein [Dichotomicrobium thermohalophilum]